MISNALAYVQKNGICSEEEYPYTGKEGTCKDTQCSLLLQTKGFYRYSLIAERI